MRSPLRTLPFLAALLVPLAASAADKVRLPEFKPPLGQEISYRVTVESTGSMGGEPLQQPMNGVFINKMTAVSREGVAWRIRWQGSAAAPADAGPGPFPANTMYANTIRYYGTDTIHVQAGWDGQPFELEEASRILDVMRNARGPNGEALPADSPILRQYEVNPLLMAKALAPAMSIAFPGLDGVPDEVSVGESYQYKPDNDGDAPPVTPVVIWKLEGIDRNARTMTWVWSITLDEMTLTRLNKANIDAGIASLQARKGPLPPEKLDEYSRASAKTTGRLTYGLDDAVPLTAELVIESRMGPMLTRSVSRIARQ